MNTVALIDAGGANLGSVRYALERLGAPVRIVRDADELRGVGRIVLPGVGAASNAMSLLRARGFDAALRELPVPLLGICLGMQLLFESSEEGDVACLGLLPGRVRRLGVEKGVRVPHMGWNVLAPLGHSRLLRGLGDDQRMYFVHGYAAPVSGDCVAACTHGAHFAAVVERGNALGVQFHPERSSSAGARLLANFLALDA
ncbi:MAG: imidazole glycerol phosphate synthase subunit HisH [Lysobacter sp.]|nr:imidazole glycerol phosphate synthase subunit HisH [Lysobacter sp.]